MAYIMNRTSSDSYQWKVSKPTSAVCSVVYEISMHGI